MTDGDAGQNSEDSARCPVCSSPIEKAGPRDADNQVRLHPCNHYVTVGDTDD